MSPRRSKADGARPGPRAGPPGGRTHRGFAILVLTGLLVAGGVADRRAHVSTARQGNQVSTQVPLAAPASARSSAWYCPGAALAGTAADTFVVVANAGTRPLNGTVTVYPDKGDSRQVAITAGPAGRAVVRLADLVSSAYAAAVVELDGGDAVTELASTGAVGDSVTPCASSASPTWYFAEGVTTKDASETLLVLNPFPDDAVVDVLFSTEEGVVTPQALTGLLVKAQGLTPINVGDYVQRREGVSVSLTARTGRLAVGRVQTFDGTGTSGRKGLSVTLGAAAAGPVWYFPEGLVADGQNERYQVYNPGDQESQVEVDLALESGQAEPLKLTVPRQARVTVVSADESRIPKGVPHAVTIRTTEGPDVVAERTIDGASPSPHTGLSITLGSRLPAKRWAAAAGTADDSTDEIVVVQNPGPRTALITVNLLADGSTVPLGGMSGVEVPAGQRRSLRINASLKRPAVPLLVTSSEAVLVERDYYRLKSPGLGMSAAIPLR